jgi:hypothetical protein
MAAGDMMSAEAVGARMPTQVTLNLNRDTGEYECNPAGRLPIAGLLVTGPDLS